MAETREDTTPPPGAGEIGVLHPGAMGASLGAALLAGAAASGSGARVIWAGEGRSAATRERAEAAGLTDAGSVASLVARARVVLSICPPHAAAEVAAEVASYLAADADLLYIDANAVAPATVASFTDLFGAGNVVDAAVVGPPAWKPGTSTLWLSGPHADEAARLFSGSVLSVRVLGPRVGQASMAKACYALQSKALPTIWLALEEAARDSGVLDAVRDELASDGIDLDANAALIRRRAAEKAWRWAGEMDEAAAAFAAAGLPDGWSRAAAEMYRRFSSS